jgi:ATPase MipZ
MTGWSRRVVFREPFLNGLTPLGLKEGRQIAPPPSHAAARREARGKVRAPGLPEMQ